MAHNAPCVHVPQGYPPCQICVAFNNAANSSSQAPHSEPAVCQFLDMLEQSFAPESQQTGARPAGRDLYVTPSQMNMNLGVGSPCSTYPLFAGSRAQQSSQATQPTPAPGPPRGTNG